MSKKPKATLQCNDTVIHPVHGESVICLVDTGYASGRGWICCNFGNSGGFCCYPDEVTPVKHIQEDGK